jgi:hypothetical protein
MLNRWRRTAVAPVKVTEIREGTEPIEKIGYDPSLQVVSGVIKFTCTPIPLLDLTNDAELKPTSIYYGVVVKSLLDWLNKYFNDFTDPEGNDISGVKWDWDDIESVYMTSETFGVALISKANAEAFVRSLGFGAKLLLAERKRLEAFRKKIQAIRREVPMPRFASAMEVADAFAGHRQYQKPAGAMALVGGKVYSYGKMIAFWWEGEPVVNISRYGHTTTMHQNAVIRALQEKGLRPMTLEDDDFERFYLEQETDDQRTPVTASYFTPLS